ncbi:hypothetical protein [Streptomyces sp. NPDC046870]|uniref:hypothetical protein n=1 Tax=Streptomyces sp. NPDC046870 TaxID=3155135 RepID=UPI0034556543
MVPRFPPDEAASYDAAWRVCKATALSQRRRAGLAWIRSEWPLTGGEEYRIDDPNDFGQFMADFGSDVRSFAGEVPNKD